MSTSKGVVIPLAQAPARAPAKRNAGGADMRRVGPMNLAKTATRPTVKTKWGWGLVQGKHDRGKSATRDANNLPHGGRTETRGAGTTAVTSCYHCGKISTRKKNEGATCICSISSAPEVRWTALQGLEEGLAIRERVGEEGLKRNRIHSRFLSSLLSSNGYYRFLV